MMLYLTGPVHMLENVHMCVMVHVCGGQRTMSGFIPVPQALSTLVFETGSLFDLGLAK